MLVRGVTETASYILPSGKAITGTLVWYCFICKREVWLMGHEITPDEDFPSLEIGRAIHEVFYDYMPKEIALEGMKIDLIGKRKIVYEVKASSKFIEAARFQLLYYLYRLREYGVDASGQISVPKERKKIEVALDEAGEKRLLGALAEIRNILAADVPPAPVKTPYCRRCAYKEFCWV
jgi:CRISPR-associated exonuclease Cas4